MTSSSFSRCRTPSLPLSMPKSTQSRFLLSDFELPPPVPLPEQTSFVRCPLSDDTLCNNNRKDIPMQHHIIWFALVLSGTVGGFKLLGRKLDIIISLPELKSTKLSPNLMAEVDEVMLVEFMVRKRPGTEHNWYAGKERERGRSIGSPLPCSLSLCLERLDRGIGWHWAVSTFDRGWMLLITTLNKF